MRDSSRTTKKVTPFKTPDGHGLPCRSVHNPGWQTLDRACRGPGTAVHGRPGGAGIAALFRTMPEKTASSGPALKINAYLLTSRDKNMIINANDGIMPYPGLAADQEKNA